MPYCNTFSPLEDVVVGIASRNHIEATPCPVLYCFVCFASKIYLKKSVAKREPKKNLFYPNGLRRNKSFFFFFKTPLYYFSVSGVVSGAVPSVSFSSVFVVSWWTVRRMAKRAKMPMDT